MNENKRTRKEWIKNAAIVFLTVMLILTFFSNTIMNYSLPEVSAKYANSGNITTKIRGTGTVESPDPYDVKYKGATRVVESIEVTVGDFVEKGTVLCYLSGEESSELSAKREAYENAKKIYEEAVLSAPTTDLILNGGGVTSWETHKAQVISQKNVIAAAQAEVDKIQNQINEYDKQIAAIELQIQISGLDANKTITQEDVNNAILAWQNAKNQLSTINASIVAKESEISAESDETVLASLREELNTLKAQQLSISDLVTNKEIEKNTAESEWKKKTDAIYVINNVTSQKAVVLVNKQAFVNELANKEAIVTAETNILSQMELLYTETNRLEELKKAMNEAKADVDKLLEQSQGTQVVAPLSGTIMEVNIRSGNELSEGIVPFKMQRDGLGYTLSFTVTNEQAKRLSVGDVGEPVNSWRYNDMEFVITSIKPDKTNPAQNKMITFDVVGEYIVPGQSITLSVGQKSAYYDAIVPNSAIREDSNGKFVLVVESKNNAFVNRYIATRMDVQVIASDDTQSAVSGIYGWEYVITTSDKPVEAGQQVRFAEN